MIDAWTWFPAAAVVAAASNTTPAIDLSPIGV
jgi:hypothetical protein